MCNCIVMLWQLVVSVSSVTSGTAPVATRISGQLSRAAPVPLRHGATPNDVSVFAMRLTIPHVYPCAVIFRELFSDFFQSLFGYPLPQLLADSPAPAAAQLLYSQMMRDILGGGGEADPLAQVQQHKYTQFLGCTAAACVMMYSNNSACGLELITAERLHVAQYARQLQCAVC